MKDRFRLRALTNLNYYTGIIKVARCPSPLLTLFCCHRVVPLLLQCPVSAYSGIRSREISSEVVVKVIGPSHLKHCYDIALAL